LIQIQHILSDLSGIKIIYLTEKDVVRHSLVQKIIKAFEEYEKSRKVAEQVNGEQTAETMDHVQ
jgi:phosphate starvation-inducible PhoH-like protein